MADDSQLDVVQHPVLGPLKFPKSMSPDERNQVIDRHMADYKLTQQTAAAAPGGQLPIAPVNKNIVQGMPPSQFESDVATGMGLDPNKIAANPDPTAQWKELFGQVRGGMTGFGKSVAKDPFNIANPVESMAGSVEKAAQQRSPGQMLGALSNVAMGMEAANPEMPSLKSTGDLKTGVGDASYRRGLGVQQTLESASQNIHDAVGNAAQGFVKKVDAKFPGGAIDPKPIMDAVNNAKEEIVKTPEKYPAGIAQMLEPDGPKSTGPRVMGGHLDLSDPAQLASFQRMKAQGMFTPQEIARMEGGGDDMWSAEEAKQWRSKIGAAVAKSSGPMKPVLTGAYEDLTKQLRKAADDSGALSEFEDYNNLHKKHMQFLNDPTVKKIMGGDTTADTLAPLSDPRTMAHLRTLLGNWDEYGINTKDLQKEGSDYGKAQSIMEKKGFRWFPGGTLGGAIGSHLLGMPWVLGAGAGLAVDRMISGAGKASKFIESSKVSPFYGAGAVKAADISRGWSEGLPEIAAKKVALKKAIRGSGTR